MAIFGNFKSTIGSIPGTLWKTIKDVTPGNEVAKGAGQTIALNQSIKQQEEYTERRNQSISVAIDNLREAREEGDEERAQRMRKVLKDLSGEGNDFIQKQVDDTVTNRQIIASAGELMATAALAGMIKLPKAASGKFVSRASIQSFKASQLAKGAALTKGQKALKTTKTLAKESAVGAGFFALIKAQEENADTSDIIHAAEMGAMVGPGVLLAAKGVGAFVSKVNQKVGPEVKQFFSNMEKKAVELQSKKPKNGATMTETILSRVGEKKTPVQYGADMYLKTVQGARQFKAKALDRFSSIKRMEEIMEEVSGRPLKESEKVYRNVRLLTAESMGAAEVRLERLANDLRPYNDIMDESKAYLVQLDMINRARLGQKTAGQKAGVKNIDRLKELQDELRIFADEIGPENMRRLGEVRTVYRGYQRKLLQDRVDSGIISQKAMDDMMAANPDYIPHNVIMDIDEKAVNGMNRTLNVSKTDLVKAVGSARNIEDPFIATTQRTYVAERLINKNRWLKELTDAQTKYDAIPGMKKIASNVKPQKGYGKVNFFQDGKKVTWQVPKDVEIAIKGTDMPINSWFFNTVVAGPATLLKKGATQLNLTFSIPNKFRDKQTALITADAFIEELAKKSGVSRQKVNLSKQQLKDLYKQSGGYGASIFREGDDSILSRMEQAGVVKRFNKKDLARPDKLIEKINEQLEQSTRMEVFKKGLARGLSPKDAALASRDATVDFAKMGSWMQTVNKVVPFLNARVQGFSNLVGAVAKDPEMFARMQLYTAVYPTMMIHSHNRKYESYSNISDYWKARYWIIMTGEVETTDKYTGQPTTIPQFITIPKGEGQALVSGPIQYYLDRADEADYRSTGQMIADTALNASPVSVQSFGEANLWSTTIAQLGPLATVPFGMASNVHPFFGKPIVPEDRVDASPEKQFGPKTPETTKALANMMGIAPARLEYFLDSFGGLPQDAQTVADMVFGVIKGEDVIDDLKEESLSETTMGAVGRLPITHAFVREASEFYGPESEFRKKQKKVFETEAVDTSLDKKDKAEEILKELNRLETREEKKEYLRSQNLDEDMIKRVERLKKSRQSVETLRPNDPVSVRAGYIKARLDDMKLNGDSREERKEFLQELQEARILTDSVIEAMHQL